MRRTAREASPLELKLWRHVVRDVQPLEPIGPPEDDAGETAQAMLPPPPSGPAAPPPLQAAARGARPPPGPSPANLDRRSFQRLQRGQYPISARLDLHGLTAAEAHALLVTFLQSRHAQGARCVLVITGRGLRSGGTLRGETPRWLAAPPLADIILATAPARLAHGGEGALYVLLRRKRPS